MTTKRLWPEVADSLKLTRDLDHDFKPLCQFLPTASLYLPSSSEQGTVSVLVHPSLHVTLGEPEQQQNTSTKNC